MMAVACIVVLAGCEAQVVKVPPRENVFDPDKIDVKVGNELDLAALIAKHKGEVVFVDYWATWCEPCVKAFPHTVDAYEQYHDKGFAAIGVSFDEPDAELKVRRFLAEHRVRFENLINEYGIGTEYTEKFQLNQIPKFRLYDRHGKLRGDWDSVPADFDAQLKKLLAEK